MFFVKENSCESSRHTIRASNNTEYNKIGITSFPTVCTDQSKNISVCLDPNFITLHTYRHKKFEFMAHWTKTYVNLYAKYHK